MDNKSQQFLPPQCDHTDIESQMQRLTTEQDEAWLRPVRPETDEMRREEFLVMTRDAGQSTEKVRGLRTQLAHALILTA
jgi:hypothetical protein